jgi:hypothetical protein
MTPDEPIPYPESTTRGDTPAFDQPAFDAAAFEPAGASGFDARELHGETDRDESGWQIDEPLDDDRYDERYPECHDDDDGRDDDWADHRWDRFDGYESLHQRHAPHDWPIFDQPLENPALDDEAPDPLDVAEREAEAADPDAYRWFRQEADDSWSA